MGLTKDGVAPVLCFGGPAKIFFQKGVFQKNIKAGKSNTIIVQ
jgi:hypothetical protein